MEPFAYIRVDEPEAALEQAGADSRAKFLAGGTTLLDLAKLDVETPSRVIDINRLPLSKIEILPNSVRIGALVRNSDLAYHEIIHRHYPVLSQALLAGATPQIRNMATVAGNLLQRTRCPYFRDVAWPCNKREPGSGCSAIDGYNRGHAVLGTSDRCIATHPSDMSVALAALDAVVVTRAPAGERRIAINEFFVPYGEDPVRETVLAQNELIMAVELPRKEFFARSHYLKVRDRASFEFALVSVAAALEIEKGTIRSARLALGGVATKPWRVPIAEGALIGAQAGKAAYAAAAEKALEGAKPQKFNAFKIELAKRTIVRALEAVGAMS
jgi:xanthine dehydrogenase YagS FAD-binding subunit